MPVTWIDGVTPVNAANLEIMEADTAAAAAPGSPAAKLTAGGLGALLFTGVGPAPAWSDPLKFKTDANGVLGWGDGTTSDTSLYRLSANALRTPGFLFTGAATASGGSSAGAGTHLGPGGTLSSIRAALGGLGFTTAIVGDAQYRFMVGSDGALSWSDGTLVADTTLYRSAAATLKTDGTFVTVGGLHVEYGTAGWMILGGARITFGSAGDTNLYRSAAGVLRTDGVFLSGGGILAYAPINVVSAGAILTGVASGGDTNYRFTMGNDGSMNFGPGNAPADTNLYRSAANVLKTDDSFEAAEITSPLRLAPGTQPTQITNFDTLNKTGWYSAPNGATGSPDAAESFHVHVIAHDQVSGVTVQFAYAYSTSKSYWRRQYGSWTAWYLMTDTTGGGGGGGVDYIGTWGAGTAYKKGDVVRHNSFDYMAVNDSTGVTPPAPTPATIVPGVAYGTSLPSTGLYDGMEAILVDSLTAATYQWRFRYNAAGGAYKWEFVGGTRANIKPVDWTMSGAGAWQMTGATFAVPRAGIYECSGQARLAGGGGSDQYMGFSVGGGVPASHWGVTTSNLGHASGIEHLSVGAGSTIGMAHYTTSAAGTWQFRSFFVQPVKVA